PRPSPPVFPERPISPAGVPARSIPPFAGFWPGGTAETALYFRSARGPVPLPERTASNERTPCPVFPGQIFPHGKSSAQRLAPSGLLPALVGHAVSTVPEAYPPPAYHSVHGRKLKQGHP